MIVGSRESTGSCETIVVRDNFKRRPGQRDRIQSRSLEMQKTTILALSVRILIALSTRTFFQPDEYYQALEPAHALVFGYGHLTWEWLTPQPIRSVIYPALNVPIYWLLKVTGLHTVWPSLVVCMHSLKTRRKSHELLGTRRLSGQSYCMGRSLQRPTFGSGNLQ